MFNILVVVFLYLISYIFPSLQELRSVSYRRALLFLHPKVNIFSSPYKTFFKFFILQSSKEGLSRPVPLLLHTSLLFV